MAEDESVVYNDGLPVIITYLADCVFCPACKTRWRETLKDGREGSRLIGIYSRERDMTIAWRCPDCAREWPRGTLASEAEGSLAEQESDVS